MKKLKSKIDKGLSLAIAKKPDRVLLVGIIILNIILVIGAGAMLVVLFPSLREGEGVGFWKTVYNVFTMILDAGCISSIVEKDPNNAFLPILCIVIIFLGTLSFTGAIIGYLSNRISDFISEANKGTRRLIISDHTVLINWNNRASEIINDLFYSDYEEKVVVLVSEGKEEIELNIKNRIADTLEREKLRLAEQADKRIAEGTLRRSQRRRYIREHNPIQKVTVIVRQGEVFSLKQLNDISVSTAKNVIILGKNSYNDVCRYNAKEILEKAEKGNIETIKTLVQVSEITSAETSADNQKVVVEVEDEWTMMLVNKIIKHKAVKGKCNIIPVPVNRILGQILSQFSIMPELNSVYSELFSNRGATFYSCPFDASADEVAYFSDYLKNHEQALPITTMNTPEGRELFYIAGNHESLDVTCSNTPQPIDLRLNERYRFKKRHVAIIGHNSKCIDIMEGFYAFVSEWQESGEELLDILIIDDSEHLKKVDYYNEYRGEDGRYSFIKKVIAAEVYDYELICEELNTYIDSHEEDTSVLILSNDRVSEEELDSNALTYLVYLQDIIYERKKSNPQFNPSSIDVVVELLNPKNYDVVKSYSVDNVIISNRYISRMIVQIGNKESIYTFYKDILTYDLSAQKGGYTSKELYIKDADRLFDENTVFPIVTTPRNLVAGIYAASPENNKTIILGLIKVGERKTLFSDSKNKEISIDKNDKLILFAPH